MNNAAARLAKNSALRPMIRLIWVALFALGKARQAPARAELLLRGVMAGISGWAVICFSTLKWALIRVFNELKWALIRVFNELKWALIRVFNELKWIPVRICNRFKWPAIRISFWISARLKSVRVKVFWKVRFELWRRVHKLPYFFARCWQLAEFRKLLAVAYEHTDFYKKLLEENSIQPSDIRTFADIRKLPLTSKALMRRHHLRALVNNSFPASRAVWTKTSGTTGEPFIFPIDRYGRLGDYYNLASQFRFLLWRGVPLGYLISTLKVAEISHNESGLKDGRFLVIHRSRLRDDAASILRDLKKFNPDIVVARPTIFLELARHLENIPAVSHPKFSFLLANGEMMSRAMRELIASSFGGEVYSDYGLEEAGVVAVECAEHDGYHINEEACILEIIGDDGQTLEAGNWGRVVITRFFYNDVMPFIRYDTGDSGMIMAGSCPCGLEARRLRVIGRRGIFVTLGGRRFHVGEFEVVLEEIGGKIMRYQIAKIGNSSLQIRIIPATRLDPAGQAFISGEFERRFGITPEILVVDSLPHNPSGKTPPFVDESVVRQ